MHAKKLSMVTSLSFSISMCSFLPEAALTGTNLVHWGSQNLDNKTRV